MPKSPSLVEQAQRAVELARKKGAQQVWVACTKTREVNCEVRAQKLETLKEATSRKMHIRLFVDGRYSAHSSTDLRPETLDSFLSKSVALAKALQPDAARSLANPALYGTGRSAQALGLVDPRIIELTTKERLDYCMQMNREASHGPNLVSAESGFTDHHRFVAAASSNGFSDAFDQTSAYLWTSVTLKDKDRLANNWSDASGRQLQKLPSAKHIGQDALARTQSRIGVKKGATKTCPMVVDPRVSGYAVYRLLSPAMGSSIQQQRSFWLGKLGQKIVSDKLTIVDNPLAPGMLRSRPFDGEGIAGRELTLIDKGVARNYYLDTYYGNKLKMAPTTGSPSNRVVALGKKSGLELVAEIPDGVYVNRFIGGNMDRTTGDFSFGASGHEIKNGKLGAPIAEVNITGNILQLWSKLHAVGNDPWRHSSMPTPTLVFDEVSFSGT